MGQVINGGDLMLFLGGTSIAFSTSHKLSISAETVEQVLRIMAENG